MLTLRYFVRLHNNEFAGFVLAYMLKEMGLLVHVVAKLTVSSRRAFVAFEEPVLKADKDLTTGFPCLTFVADRDRY